MNLSKLLPMSIMGGIAYTQQESIEVIVQAPMEAAQIVRCRMEIGGMQRILLIDALTGDIPKNLERDFPTFLRKHMMSNGNRDVALDPWGHAYQIEVRGTEIEIWSFGPDGFNRTADDIWAKVPMS